MDTIKMYDKVKLKDGREASIVEILGKNEAFIADIASFVFPFFASAIFIKSKKLFLNRSHNVRGGFLIPNQ